MALVKVAEVNDIPVGSCKKVIVKRQPIAVFNLDGEFYAIHDTCSHADASLSEGEIVDGCKVSCPLHGALFDIKTGNALTFPAVSPVEKFEVKVDGTAIFLEV